MRWIKQIIKNSDFLFQHYLRFLNRFRRIRHFFVSDEKIIKKRWKKVFGKQLDLSSPITLNEKIQWLKLYGFSGDQTILADKFASRDFWAHNFGNSGLVPLLFTTSKVKDINARNINVFPCIVKPNNCSGFYYIIRKKEDVNWHVLRRHCRTWLHFNYYVESQEKPYKGMKPRIIVEKLLLTKSGKLPNDYKLNFFNGELGFVYCSIDREGKDYRAIYDGNWRRMPFSWVEKGKTEPGIEFGNISKPASFDQMVKIGSAIAKNYKYVRVDFYDVDGALFYGEITFYHGSGFDVFTPSEWDVYWGNRLFLK